MRKSTLLLPILVVLGIAALSAVFIVDEREKALVLRFGRVVDVKETPGLAFKLPVIDNVVRYDDRILSLEVGPLEVTPLDDRRLIVDAFSRYRIANVDTFRQAVGAGGIGAAESRLDKIMRLALALERELQDVADAGGSENAHWYNIIGSPPLRSVFETALGLPSGIGQLDIERQLSEMKDRAFSAFGTTHPADFLEPEMLDQFRKRFLLLSDLNSF